MVPSGPVKLTTSASVNVPVAMGSLKITCRLLTDPPTLPAGPLPITRGP